ncbi:hypothetical protein Bhyg_01228 [Pseudolycoriella hygida]|uniref:Uncharacterized protein n=1 Tax=Pseudolycoriella hygida TaxID=35572 RepID=A0A9Q0N996_9DIPT|nr:hypothetical protein Bhyg_01228 [Pseudolycoriella hygida]
MASLLFSDSEGCIGPTSSNLTLQPFNSRFDDIITTHSKPRDTLSSSISIDKKALIVYFSEAATKYKPSTLWSMYSMLKKTLISTTSTFLK